MMNKKALRIVLVAGLVLVVASIVIPLVLTVAAGPGASPEHSIIGGAEMPTFLFFYSQFSKVYFWFMLIGVCLLIGSIIGQIVCKK
jgi:hypothetical protein